MNWKKYFSKDKEIILVSASTGGLPNASIVVSVGLSGDEVLVANCHLFTTVKNIKENKNVCLVGGYFRIKGEAKIFTKGRHFDLCVKENKGYSVPVSSAILVKIKEVFDLDKVKAINI